MWFWCLYWEEGNSTVSSYFSVNSKDSLRWPAVQRCQCLIDKRHEKEVVKAGTHQVWEVVKAGWLRMGHTKHGNSAGLASENNGFQ